MRVLRYQPGLYAAAFLMGCGVVTPALAGMTLLTPAGPTFTKVDVYGVSGDGRYVIGEMENPAIFHGARWAVDNSSVDDLGLLPGRPYSQGTALSFDGSAASVDAINTAYNPQGFLWTAGGNQTPLPLPSGTCLAVFSSRPTSRRQFTKGWCERSEVHG